MSLDIKINGAARTVAASTIVEILREEGQNLEMIKFCCCAGLRKKKADPYGICFFNWMIEMDLNIRKKGVGKRLCASFAAQISCALLADFKCF